MEAKLVSGHAKAKKTEHHGHKATHMRLEAAKNGVMAHTEHERPEMSRNQKMGMGDTYQPPEPHVFTRKKDLIDHVTSSFGHVLADDPEEAEEDDKKMNEHGKPAKTAAKRRGASKGPVTDEYEDENDESD